MLQVRRTSAARRTRGEERIGPPASEVEEFELSEFSAFASVESVCCFKTIKRRVCVRSL